MNQLKPPKTQKASFDICGDRLTVINFLKKSDRFHTFAELRRQIGIPDRRLGDILNNRCEGYVAKQCGRYGYSRTEKVLEQPKPEPQPKPKPPKPKPQPKPIKVIGPETETDLVKLAKKGKAKMRSQLPALRRAAIVFFKNKGYNEVMAKLKAYQQHPDI